MLRKNTMNRWAMMKLPRKIVSGDPWWPQIDTRIDGKLETAAWAWERPDAGRSFGFSGLHFHVNWERQEYRRLVLNAVKWTLGE